MELDTDGTSSSKESKMELLRNKDIKRFFGVVLTACLLLLLFALPLPVFAAFGNRALLSAHDAAVFYSVFLFVAILIFTAVIFSAFFRYFARQQKKLDEAGTKIKAFTAGDTSGRLESEEEGSLSRLFSSVNLMATALNAHIEAGKKTKDFLKQTIEDVSHQLKTPLASLQMCNEIIRSESGNEASVRRFSEKAELALTHMESLIQNLLKISRFDAGVVELHKTAQSLGPLLRETVSEFEVRMEQEQKSICLDGEEDTKLSCDRDWIMEAVGNLIKNALDHTDAGGKISVRWKETPVITQIMVEDNGTGIHPEDIHHIFKRFYRSRFAQDTQGIGLGLSLAKSIVEAHNGTITVASELGKGTVFTLDFLKLTSL